MTIDSLDQQLLGLLKQNARTSTSELARKLHVSRSTIQDRLKRLESGKIISGFSVNLHPEYTKRLIIAQVMIQINPKMAVEVTRALRKIEAVKVLQAVSGPYDLVAEVSALTTEDIDQSLDLIGDLDGVEKTMTSIVLSTKFMR